MDLNQIFDGKQFVLTGNYPYDISSQIFFKMLDYKDLIPCCTGMIQREVALRMASEPGNKAYGILSVLIQAWYDVEYLFTVDEGVFNPPPKVKSAVIRMTRNEVTDLGCDEKLFKRLVKTVFNQRRKMLRVSLKQMFPGVTPRENFYTTDIMTKRPEQLSIQQFVELTNYVGEELKRLELIKNKNIQTMIDVKETLNSAAERMEMAAMYLAEELSHIRAGRANVAILDGVRVNSYGSMVPLNQVATVTTPDARTIAIRPWDKKAIKDIEKAIMDSGVGITPENNGEIVRLGIPQPTGERRKELVKQCNKIAERAKIEVRNVRQEIKEKLKKAIKDGLSEDLEKDAENDLQKLHDKYIKQLESLMDEKEKEIMTV